MQLRTQLFFGFSGLTPWLLKMAERKLAHLILFEISSLIIKFLSIYSFVSPFRMDSPTVNHHRRLTSTVTLNQAVGDAPSLARLTQLVRESNDRLKAIEPLIPGGLRPAVKAGPIDGESWCLLVSGNAAAAKIRQLIPMLQASLLRQGWNVTTIRLKILFVKKQ